MIAEKFLYVQLLRIAPTILIAESSGNFSRGKAFNQSGRSAKQFAVEAYEPRSKHMRDEREEEQKRHVHFRNVRSPEVFEKERVPLQELDHRIDQVGEQDREGEDYE